ncbi:MAG: hypothetical protein P8Y70_11310 [Candidatus Lokiarchaeota archaeon]
MTFKKFPKLNTILETNISNTAKTIKSIEPQDAALQFIERFEAWMKKVGMYSRLSEVGIGKEKLESMAADVVRIYGGGEDHIKSLKPLTKEDIAEMLTMAL